MNRFFFLRLPLEPSEESIRQTFPDSGRILAFGRLDPFSVWEKSLTSTAVKGSEDDERVSRPRDALPIGRWLGVRAPFDICDEELVTN